MLKFEIEYCISKKYLYICTRNNNHIKIEIMSKSELEKRLKETKITSYRITNRLGKLILTVSWKEYQFIADTDIDEDLSIKINLI